MESTAIRILQTLILCLWKFIFSIFSILILQIPWLQYPCPLSLLVSINFFFFPSDSKSDLEEEIDNEEEDDKQEDQQEQEQEEQEQEKQQQPKGASAKKRQAADDQLTIIAKRRKINRQEEKAKRDAQIAAADRLAETIFQKSFSCSSCSSLKTTVSSREEDIRRKDTEITQLKTEIADLMESLKVKKLVVASMELENKQLKTRLGKSQNQQGNVMHTS